MERYSEFCELNLRKFQGKFCTTVSSVDSDNGTDIKKEIKVVDVENQESIEIEVNKTDGSGDGNDVDSGGVI